MYIGQKVRFDPFSHAKGFAIKEQREDVTGTVSYIHEAHGWFNVEYCGFQTGFRMDDIGTEVILIG